MNNGNYEDEIEGLHARQTRVEEEINGIQEFIAQKKEGIAVADAKNTFTPSSDAIIDASRLVWLDRYIHFAQLGKRIILFTFCISAVYNFIGLYYAIQGTLSPVIAAILMPASSLSIILLTYGLTDWVARIKHFKN